MRCTLQPPQPSKAYVYSRNADPQESYRVIPESKGRGQGLFVPPYPASAPGVSRSQLVQGLFVMTHKLSRVSPPFPAGVSRVSRSLQESRAYLATYSGFSTISCRSLRSLRSLGFIELPWLVVFSFMLQDVFLYPWSNPQLTRVSPPFPAGVAGVSRSLQESRAYLATYSGFSTISSRSRRSLPEAGLY